MNGHSSLKERARELGLAWCVVRLITAVPLLCVLGVAWLLSPDHSPLRLWWEWVAFRPLVPRNRRAQVESGWGAEGVSVHDKARTLTSLRPAGKVRVNGRVCEARSESGWIDLNADVLVVGKDAFGLIVRTDAGRNPSRPAPE
jgi:hypothetical protein